MKKVNTQEEKKEAVLKGIEQFFKENGISGIINIPKIGSFSMFNNEADRLLVLDYAKLEIEIDKLHKRSEAAERITEGLVLNTNKKDNTKSFKEISYVG